MAFILKMMPVLMLFTLYGADNNLQSTKQEHTSAAKTKSFATISDDRARLLAEDLQKKLGPQLQVGNEEIERIKEKDNKRLRRKSCCGIWSVSIGTLGYVGLLFLGGKLSIDAIDEKFKCH